MKTILVVDNSPVVLKLLVEFLKKQGHSVIAAEDGLAALEILKETKPDIVITDLIMPNINGEKLCRVIRGRVELRDIPVIIYSSTMLEDTTDILGIGADVCVVKGPFKDTGEHLLRIIRHIDNNTLHELKGEILGGEELYKRHITSELLLSKRHYESIFDNLPEGVVEFTVDGRIFQTNSSAVALCGMPEESLLASDFFDLFSGEHRERLRDLLRNPAKAPLSVGEDAPVLLNGKMITIHFLYNRDRDGARDFIVAIMWDLTDKITTARELERLRRRQERILNAVGEGIFGLDNRNHVTFVNPAALAMLGCTQDEVVGGALREIIHPGKPEEDMPWEHECPLCNAPQDGMARTGTETFQRKDGSCFPVRYTCTPIKEGDAVLGAVIAFADITELKKMEEKLLESAMTDELTGLFNRRGFMTMADKLIKISGREKTDLLLLYLDFDNLKWINDSLGHTVGDQAIIETATLLQETFRLADVVGRLGGDEFIILCTDKSTHGNKTNMLHRLNANIEQANGRAGRQYPLSVSVGTARYEHRNPCTLEELLHRADQAMYENKEDKKTRHQDGYQH